MPTATLIRPSTPDQTQTSLRERALALLSATRLRSLVVLETPELSQAALDDISQIARWSGGGVTLLRPIDQLPWVQALDDPLTESALRAEGQRYLDDAVQQLGPGVAHVSTRVTIGLPVRQAIAETARDYAAGLIVVVQPRTE
jgi:nucleotide-binding universal stress UspA family protein